jgi:hypothetical protein
MLGLLGLVEMHWLARNSFCLSGIFPQLAASVF